MTSFPSFPSSLTLIFVKHIALNMSETLVRSVSQILKIKMIHKDSTGVYSHQAKISREKKNHSPGYSGHKQKVIIFRSESEVFFSLCLIFPRFLEQWGLLEPSVIPASVIYQVATFLTTPPASGVCLHLLANVVILPIHSCVFLELGHRLNVVKGSPLTHLDTFVYLFQSRMTEVESRRR